MGNRRLRACERLAPVASTDASPTFRGARPLCPSSLAPTRTPHTDRVDDPPGEVPALEFFIASSSAHAQAKSKDQHETNYHDGDQGQGEHKIPPERNAELQSS